MTSKEAIKYAKENILADTSEMAEFKVLAIEAIEKQIPKTPNYMPDDDTCLYYHWECPECGNYYSYSIRKTFSVLYNNSVSYCSRCGQALDWSEERGE